MSDSEEEFDYLAELEELEATWDRGLGLDAFDPARTDIALSQK